MAAITDFKYRIFKDADSLASFINGGGTQPAVVTSGNSLPLNNLATRTLVIKISTDAGASFPTTRTHTFGAGTYTTIASVVADINGDATFLGSNLQVYAVGNELAVKSIGLTNAQLRVDATSTGIAGAGLLAYTSGLTMSGAVSTIVSITTDASGKFTLFYL